MTTESEGAPNRLTAIFQAVFPALRVRGPWPLAYRVQVEGFDVTVVLRPDAQQVQLNAGDTVWTHLCSEGIVLASRTELAPPPALGATEGGGRDFKARIAYFSGLGGYRRAAGLAVRRATAFMTHALHQTSRGRSGVHQNPAWIDGTGAELETGILEFEAVYEGIGEFSEVVFDEGHEAGLLTALADGFEPTLVQSFLAHAQHAARSGQIERFVLELAIACEVFAKQAAFAGSDRAARIFDALEEGQHAEIPVPKLIDLLGKSSSSKQSFRTADRAAADDIEHLFRARNKVAHRGQTVYKDEKGTLRSVTRIEMTRWWASAEKMMSWVRALPD